jgi:hypothetical protein
LKSPSVFFAIVVVATGATLTNPSLSQTLASHRATYAMNLVSALTQSGIVGVTGVFLVERIPECKGVTLRQAVQLTLRVEGGAAVSTRFAATVWENDDATSMTFSTVNEVAGDVVEVFTGIAALSGPGFGGRVDYTEPTTSTMALPSGVLFPIALSRAVLAAAEAGTRRLDLVSFDGGGEDTLTAVSVFISAEFAAGEETPPNGAYLLADQRSWHTRYAHYEIASQAPEPIFEVGYRLFENGVITDLILDYGDFQVSGTLEGIEDISPPAC